MTDTQNPHQADIDSTAAGKHYDSVTELDDKRKTTLRENDVLIDTRTDEKLIVLGFDEEVGSIEYYSSHEESEGLHATTHLSKCFDAILRSCGGDTEVIPLTPT